MGFNSVKSSKELVDQLKAARKEKGISYQQIADATAEAGEPVSLATIKRVFSAGSDTRDFRYDTTLKPIARAVLGPDSEPEDDATNRLLDSQDAQIEELRLDVSIATHGWIQY